MSWLVAAAQIKFWVLFGLTLLAYVGYPILLAIVSRFKRIEIRPGPIEPRVTIIVAAYNEARHIEAKLRNCLGLEYPAAKLEIMVASDCSSDGTDALVEGFADQGVVLSALAERGGKTAAQNQAAARATGEILIFTDATTEFAPDMVRRMLEPFADERVGCVGAKLIYESDEGSAVGRGQGAYWRFESWLKEREAEIQSLIGVSGALYGVRASAYRALPPDLISDFVIAFDVQRQGLVTTYGQGVVSREKTNESTEREFRMRVRVIVGSLHALIKWRDCWNPFRHGWFAVALFCHKVLRYLVPEFLLGMALINAWVLATGHAAWLSIYGLTALGQLVFYLASLLGWAKQRWHLSIPAVHIPFFFMAVNAASMVAQLEYLRGERYVTWDTAR